MAELLLIFLYWANILIVGNEKLKMKMKIFNSQLFFLIFLS